MRARGAWWVWLVSLALVSQGAGAQQGLEAAKSFFEAGVKAYTSGRYAAAVEAFSESYRSAPKPQILFSLAQAERKLYIVEKDPAVLRQAIAHFRQYLGEVEQGGRRGDAIEGLTELEVLEAKLVSGNQAPAKAKTRLLITCSVEGAEVQFDGKPAGELPFLDEVKPGPHRARVSAAGYFDDEREIVAAEGATLSVDITLRPRPSKLSISARPRAEVYLDARLLGVGSIGGVEVPAGEHRVIVLENGRTTFTARVSTTRGSEHLVTARTAETRQRQASYVVGALGVSSLLVGAGLTVAALRKQGVASEIDERAGRGNISGLDLETYRSARDARDTYRQGAYVSFGLGAALGVSALGLFLFDRVAPGDAVSPANLAISPAAGRGFTGLRGRWVF